MSNDWDAFGDVLESQSGIFNDSDALRSYDSVKHAYAAEGLIVEMPCRHCGRPKQVTIMWPEIIAIAHNLSPHEAYGRVEGWQNFASPWRVTDTRKGVAYAWYPDSTICTACQSPVAPHVQPSECGRHLQEMQRNGWMSPQQHQQFVQVCGQVRTQLGRR